MQIRNNRRRASRPRQRRTNYQLVITERCARRREIDRQRVYYGIIISREARRGPTTDRSIRAGNLHLRITLHRGPYRAINATILLYRVTRTRRL